MSRHSSYVEPGRANRQLTVEYKAISQLKPDKNNPRLHGPAQVKKLGRSLTRFGWVTPIIVDAADHIIAGHGRILAAIQLGWKDVPTIRISDLTREQAKALQVADNQLASLAQWDRAKLGALFLELSIPELNLELEATGFEVAEIDVLIEEFNQGDQLDTEAVDALPEMAGPIVSIKGDVWQLGRHLVACADATAAASFRLFGEGKKASLAFVDPPYNVRIPGHASGNGKVQHTDFVMASGEMSPDQFTQFLAQSFSMLAENTSKGAIVFACMDWRHLRELWSAGEKALGPLLNLCVWTKDNGGMGSLYRSQHEFVAVFKNGHAPHLNNVQLGRFGRYRTNVWSYPCANTFSRTGEEGNLLALHATPKPVALVQDAILDCSRRGDIVIDTFLGSGTTVIAAERAGRTCWGMELAPSFVDTAIKRWETFTGDHAIHAVTKKRFDQVQKSRARGRGK